MKHTLIIALALLALTTTAEARHKRHHQRHHHVSTRLGDGGSFVRGRLICAINVSRWLRAHGFRVPLTASSLAFLRYHRVNQHNVTHGDVRFNYRGRRGGHVQIVIANNGGRPICLNPSSRHQGWVQRACPAGGIYLRIGS